MLFYFDFRTWLTLIRSAASEQKPSRRRSALKHVLLVVPLRALAHTVFFFLDGILFPGIWFQQVRNPVFIIGHARSGTTLTHRLMGADGRFSAFKYWELLLPSLTEKKLVHLVAWLDRTVLGRRIERRLRAWEERVFGPIRHIHHMALDIPEEDDLIFFDSCASGFWSTRVPNMGDVDFFHIDQRPPASRRRLMRFYRACVRRQLYLNGGNVIHLSKNPVFCGRVQALIEEFPDARFVIMYRNPYETIPSLLKLLHTGWKMRGDMDAGKALESSRVSVEISFETYLHPLEVLARHPQVPRAEVDYRALIAQPRATIEKVYADLGLTVSDAFRATLQKEQDKARKHETEHRYSMEEFGLDSREIRTRLAPLFERFGWDADTAQSAAVEEGRS